MLSEAAFHWLARRLAGGGFHRVARNHHAQRGARRIRFHLHVFDLGDLVFGELSRRLRAALPELCDLARRGAEEAHHPVHIFAAVRREEAFGEVAPDASSGDPGGAAVGGGLVVAVQRGWGGKDE